jgi:hypothetical protein
VAVAVTSLLVGVYNELEFPLFLVQPGVKYRVATTPNTRNDLLIFINSNFLN